MKCSKCNAEIADNAKFCPVCGAKVEKEKPVKICPNCGEVLKEGAKFCAKCGCKIEKECKCPKCGTLIKEGAKFCPVCGTKIVSGIEEPTTPLAVCEQEVPIGTTSESVSDATFTENAKGRKKSDKVIIIAAIAVLVVIVITIIAVSLSSNSDSQSDYYSENSYNSSNSNLTNTYNNRYISFKYHNNYIIKNEEEDEDGEICFWCVIDGEGESAMQVCCGEAYFLTQEDCKEVCKNMQNSMQNNSQYTYLDFNETSNKTIGNSKGHYIKYTGYLTDIWVQGFLFTGRLGNHYVTIYSGAENYTYMSQLNEIASTLKLKK